MRGPNTRESGPDPAAAGGTVLGAERPALVVAHPGHEVLVYGWLRRGCPRVFVLTDGSGREGSARIDRTSALLDRLGASPGGIYGRLRDEEVYAALLDGEIDLFLDLVQELAKDLMACGVDAVLGDMVEGINPTHDVCRLLVNAACALAGRERGAALPSWEFPEFGAPADCARVAGALRLRLEPHESQEKLATAVAYREIAPEVAAMRGRHGDSAFREEWFAPNRDAAGHYRPPGDPPVYERWARALAGSGRIARAIEYRAHVRPVAEALGRLAAGA